MIDLIVDPSHLADIPAQKLLASAAAGYVGIDHRFLHAILDRPETSLPALVAFAAEDHAKDPVDLDTVLLDVFRFLKTPEAIPFLIQLLRQAELEPDDDLIEAWVQLGAAAVDPLLQLFAELEAEGDDPGEVPFLLSQLRVRDPRILEAFIRQLARGDIDAALYLDMYGDPAGISALEAALDLDPQRIHEHIQALSAPPEPALLEDEPFDIWPEYPDEDSPPLDVLNDNERLEILSSGPVELKADVASYYRSAELPKKVAARLLELAKTDPDARVRGECWESLEELSNELEMRTAMLGVLEDAGASIEEKAGVAVALAQQTDNAAVYDAIEGLYADPSSRAKAIKAMGRSFDRRFAAFPPKHLDDPNSDIKRQAIFATGYLNLPSEAPRLEAFFDDDAFRSDALFAYTLAMPGETSRGRLRSLRNKVEEAAGGLSRDELELVEIALEQRLMLHGKDAPEPEVKPAVSSKTGRNDPCPCGSGKKYKKCCGA